MRAMSAFIVILCTLCTLSSCSNAAPPPPTGMKGFVLSSYNEGDYSSNASRASIFKAAATGVRVVEIMSTWFVDNVVNSTRVYPVPQRSPSDADVYAAIRNAHDAGMTVALKPHIDSLDGVWRANIGTQYTSEAQWVDFWSNYTAFILHFANIAAATGIELFNVGTELDGTHAHATEWRTVISEVRAVLPPTAKLWLGPNWEWNKQPGYELVSFWDALDFLGVDMYAPLASHDDPTLAEAIIGWAPIVAQLSNFSAAHGNKPFIFAEIGFASWAHAATNAPGCCSGPPDLTVQATLYESFFQAVWQETWMAGVFWWAWGTETPPCSNDFSIFGKPAALIVKAAYQATIITTTTTTTVYTNGLSAWDATYSWNAALNLKDSSLPYPGHQMSAAINITFDGALAFHAPTDLPISGITTLSFELRVPNATSGYDLRVWLCTCTDCNACQVILPHVDVDDYAPATSPCTIPTGWSISHFTFPITDLVPAFGIVGGEGGGGALVISRLQIGSDTPVNFFVDNIAFS